MTYPTQGREYAPPPPSQRAAVRCKAVWSQGASHPGPLSIVKSTRDGELRKVYYNESVYRSGKGEEGFQEITQTGQTPQTIDGLFFAAQQPLVEFNRHATGAPR